MQERASAEGGNYLSSVPEILERRLLKLLSEIGDEGILQKELWKKLNIDSRKGIKIVRRLEKQGLLVRQSVIHRGRKTYIVKLGPKYYVKKTIPSDVVGIPCFFCNLLEDCGEKISINPVNCPKLNSWLAGDP